MFRDDELIPLSALQHFVFCPRQCALIHIEQVWKENLFTAEGRIMHEKVHSHAEGMEYGVRIERGRSLRSFELGLIGKADVIEFHLDKKGVWIPYPVEYKRGRSKVEDCDRIQLCAQAMCLEEELGISIDIGAIFYGKSRRRETVRFTPELREAARQAALQVRSLIESGVTPPPVYFKKCDSCSLLEVCMPKSIRYGAVGRYIKEMAKEYEKTS